MAQSEQVLPERKLPWTIAWEAVVLIAMREGLGLISYLCPAGVWTIGWGETAGVHPNMRWTKAQADHKLLEQVEHYSQAILAMCTKPPNANQLGALVSCAYNIGLGGMKTSTIMRRHNEGDFESAARAFGLWNQFKNPKTGKREASNGLTIRRKQEAALYLTPVPDEVGALNEDMPQTVAPESPLAVSKINVGSLGGAAAAAVPFLSQLGDQAETAGSAVTKITTATTGVRGLLSQFDLTPVQVFCPLAIVGCLVAAWWRLKQRQAGWA